MTSQGSSDGRSCFLISPIGEEGSDTRKRSDTVKKHIVEAALVPNLVATVARADDDSNPGEITPAIITAILDSDLIVADLTGVNPNVFYELAVAHAYGKPTVHIRMAGETIPFDLKDVRVFEYGLDLETGDRARQLIAAAATDVLVNGKIARTPVSGGTTLLDAQRSSTSGDQIAAELLARMGDLEMGIERLSRQFRQDSGVYREAAVAESRLEKAREYRLAAIDRLRTAERALAQAQGEDPATIAELTRILSLRQLESDATLANLESAESAVQSVAHSQERRSSSIEDWLIQMKRQALKPGEVDRG